MRYTCILNHVYLNREYLLNYNIDFFTIVQSINVQRGKLYSSLQSQHNRNVLALSKRRQMSLISQDSFLFYSEIWHVLMVGPCLILNSDTVAFQIQLMISYDH